MSPGVCHRWPVPKAKQFDAELVGLEQVRGIGVEADLSFEVTLFADWRFCDALRKWTACT